MRYNPVGVEYSLGTNPLNYPMQMDSKYSLGYQEYSASIDMRRPGFAALLGDGLAFNHDTFGPFGTALDE